MKDERLRTARSRYSAEAGPRGVPAREELAAARRWLSCARDALRCAREAPGGGEGLWLAKACDALVRAEQHRASARRWRMQGNVEPADRCPACGDPLPQGADACLSCAEWVSPGEGDVTPVDDAARRASKSRAAIRAYYAAARHAVALVRVYQREPRTSGRREREALAQVARYRAAIGALRRSLRNPETAGDRPGLTKASPPGQSREATPAGRARSAG